MKFSYLSSTRMPDGMHYTRIRIYPDENHPDIILQAYRVVFDGFSPRYIVQDFSTSYYIDWISNHRMKDFAKEHDVSYHLFENEKQSMFNFAYKETYFSNNLGLYSWGNQFLA